MIILESAALTHTGLVRARNEDHFGIEETHKIYAVADGVGGLPGGEFASLCAIENVLAHFREAPSPSLLAAADSANRAVLQLGGSINPGMGIGTTLTLGRFSADGELSLVNVGDSRCYRLRDGVLACLTEDDTIENRVRRERAAGGHAVLEEWQHHTLTKCIGQEANLVVAEQRETLLAGDSYLFATDGITNMLTHARLAELLGARAPATEVMRSIIDEGLANGGEDNLTGILVRVVSLGA